MKRVLIGGFLALLSTIWALAITIYINSNLVSAWHTPPGRFLATVIETGMSIPFFLSMLFLFLGILIMGIEYFRKDS